MLLNWFTFNCCISAKQRSLKEMFEIAKTKKKGDTVYNCTIF